MKKILYGTIFLLIGLYARAQQPADTITILFTHDMHSYLAGSRETDTDGSIIRTGGYARLYTAIEQERKKAPESTLLLDGGDVVMGTFFHTLFATHAAEFNIMNKMGYEATTLGNHDFDFGVDATQQSIDVYLSDPKNICPIIISNLKGIKGTEEYLILEKAGYRIGIFGLLGTEARSESLIDKDLPYENYIEAAKRMVEYLREQKRVDIVICLSHSGTNKEIKYSEDEQLARKVRGIDVIISGHTHTLLEQPILEKGTIIGSAFAYGKYLGIIKLALTDRKPALASYELIRIDSLYAEDQNIKEQVGHYKNLVEKDYLSAMHIGFDDPVAEAVNSIYIAPDSIALGSLIADAFLDAVEHAEGQRPDIAAVPDGTIRADMLKGIVTEEEVFNILSLGIGPDKKPAFPLLKVYFSGRELRNMCEVNASIAGIMPGTHLFFSGIRYTYNSKGLFCNKARKIEVLDQAGNYVVTNDDQLYSVIVGLYTAKMIGLVSDKTYGILSVIPKNEKGEPIADLNDAIVLDTSGSEIKEWIALNNYLNPGTNKESDIPSINYVNKLSDREIEYSSFFLFDGYKYLNTFGLSVYITIVLLCVTLLFLFVLMVRKSIIYINTRRVRETTDIH
jgi:2',3'-cyclic-nucleotide 2'-phosphodiesterase (5'-nucleotidase family)